MAAFIIAIILSNQVFIKPEEIEMPKIYAEKVK